MSSHSLTRRLQALSDTHKRTLAQIQELHNFAPQSIEFPQNTDKRRLELGTEIHESLKEQEDTLELLKQEVEDGDASNQRQRRNSSRRLEDEEENERNSAAITRLTEDLKSARASFRRAQLQAKRNADNAKRKEREKLFSERTAETIANKRRASQERLTQDELALNASEDVTRALRRAHALLQGNLSQSQFAQQTLQESQDALKSLGESYGGTSDLLKNSRSLVGQLVKSNKSDTWYLQSAFVMLVMTIAWLVFRRWLYGPLWWLVWQPLKIMWWFTMTSLGTMGLGKTADTVSSGSSSTHTQSGVNARGFPTNAGHMQPRSIRLPNKGGGWGQPYAPPEPPPDQPPHNEDDHMINEDWVKRLLHGQQNTRRPGPGQAGDEAQAARNTKKRMMEVEVDGRRARDEL